MLYSLVRALHEGTETLIMRAVGLGWAVFGCLHFWFMLFSIWKSAAANGVVFALVNCESAL